MAIGYPNFSFTKMELTDIGLQNVVYQIILSSLLDRTEHLYNIEGYSTVYWNTSLGEEELSSPCVFPKEYHSTEIIHPHPE